MSMNDHASLRSFEKLEGYGLFLDGYVLSLEGIEYTNTEFFALKAKVKPRTREKDPVANVAFYQCWVILKNDPNANMIRSAFCTCKGG